MKFWPNQICEQCAGEEPKSTDMFVMKSQLGSEQHEASSKDGQNK